jgi:hypothetical protein
MCGGYSRFRSRRTTALGLSLRVVHRPEADPPWMKLCARRCPGESRDPYTRSSHSREMDPAFRRGSIQYCLPPRTDGVLLAQRSNLEPFVGASVEIASSPAAPRNDTAPIWSGSAPTPPPRPTGRPSARISQRCGQRLRGRSQCSVTLLTKGAADGDCKLKFHAVSYLFA